VHTDKNRESLPGTDNLDAAEDLQDSTLEWLLDMDMSEPEERLFAVERTGDADVGLTDYEMAVAQRPLTRGSAGADNLENYVSEEITISSETQSSDIYGGSAGVQEARGQRPGSQPTDSMAIDYSRNSSAHGSVDSAGTKEGIDILGLVDDDDMGEKYLAIKRVKPEAPKRETPTQKAGAPEQQDEPASLAEMARRLPPRESTAPSDSGEEQQITVEAGAVASAEADAAIECEMQLPAKGGVNLADTSAVEEAGGTDTGELPAAPLLLAEAPALRLVEPAAVFDLANNDPKPSADVAAEHPLASGDLSDGQGLAAAGDVFGYIAAAPPPGDDEAFDEYLLNGGQLAAGVTDFDELSMELGDGEASFDTAATEAIDYHEDFYSLANNDGDVVGVLTPLIPQLMKEVSAAVSARLSGLGLDPSAVQAELMLAGDPEVVAQLVADGFEPAIAIFSAPLESLQNLRQVDVDAIFLRLTGDADGANCNRLFSEDFAVPAADEGLSAVSDIDDEEDQFRVFEDDIFADEFGADMADVGATPQADIDALFDSLGLMTDDADDICGLDVEEFVEPVTQLKVVEQSREPARAEEAAAGSDPAVVSDKADAAAKKTAVEEVRAPSESAPATGRDVAAIEPAGPQSTERFWCIPEGISFSESSPGGGEIFADFLDAFIEEGSAELEKLEDAIASWEGDVNSEAAYTVVGRILHTIKGIAKGVGLQYYGTLIHNFETLLGALPRPQAGEESEYFRIINAWLDACVRGLDHIQEARADITHALPRPAGQPMAEVQPAEQPEAGVSQDVAPESGKSTAAAAAVPAARPIEDARAKKLSQKDADEGARALAAQQSVRITSEKLDDLLNLSNQAQQLSVRTAQSVTRGKRASTEMQTRLASVRAHIAGIADRALRSVASHDIQPGAELDALEMDQYSELQEAANILREGVEDLADLVDFATRQNTQIEALLKQQTKVISSIGTSIRAARVVPVSRLIPGLRRLVRTVSVDLDKTINFQVLNELGTLDRDDYARCQTILDHMVRNALDHGIESAGERRAAGKPETGRVTIDIRKAGADAVITLADDGRGIDPEKMRESALRKGLDLDVDALSDEEAVRLIFHKGFSTASAVSQISGRGVGMDIVLSELQEMGGDIQIESEPGRGTAFHIRVPSSVTVNGALLVSAGDESYAIPLGGLIAVEQVPVAEFFAAIQGNTSLSLGGMECEPAYLATLCNNGHTLDAKTWRTSVPVIIAGSPERYMAIAVDGVEEALELVIRSLGTQFSTVPGVAGAATTAAGEAIVALDLNLLVASVGSSDSSAPQLDIGRDEGLLVMVVDDSRTQRMVATSQLEAVGVETITAENGAVAIELLNSADRLPDVILMDVEMPVKDGIQALREIRKSVCYGHIPVIMITSRTGLKHRTMAQSAGCNGYMGKPFNFRMLVAQINELTGHRLQLS